MITARLDSTDRSALASGNLYAWEERGSRSEPGVGIERFTEGKRWTPSRLREVSKNVLSHLVLLKLPCFAGLPLLL